MNVTILGRNWLHSWFMLKFWVAVESMNGSVEKQPLMSISRQPFWKCSPCGTNKPNYFSFQKSVTFKKYANCLAFQNPVYFSNQYEIACQSCSESSACHQNHLVSNHTLTIYLCSSAGKCFYYQLAQCKKNALSCCLGWTITLMIQALSVFSKRIVNAICHSTPFHSYISSLNKKMPHPAVIREHLIFSRQTRTWILNSNLNQMVQNKPCAPTLT